MGKLELSTDRLPIFVGAGVIKEKSQIEHIAREEIVGAAIIGSYTYEEWAGNDDNGRNNVFYWDAVNKAAYNSIGLKNPGRKNAGIFLPEAIKKMQAVGQLAIISLSTLKGEDPKDVLPKLAQWAQEMGADGAELNGSCPNLDPEHALLCNDVDAMWEVVEETRARVGSELALGIKVSALPHMTIESYADARIDVDFIDLINTLGNQPSPVNPSTGRPYIEVNHGLAGQSGPIIKELARQNLGMWVRANSRSDSPEYQFLSIGGVEGVQDAYERIHKLGAFMVGGAQEFYRASDTRDVAQRWAMNYIEASELS